MEHCALKLQSVNEETLFIIIHHVQNTFVATSVSR